MNTNHIVSIRRPRTTRRVAMVLLRAVILSGCAVGCDDGLNIVATDSEPQTTVSETCVRRAPRLVIGNATGKEIVDAEVRSPHELPSPRLPGEAPADPLLDGQEVVWEQCVTGPVRLRVRTIDGIDREAAVVMGPGLTVRATVTAAGIETQTIVDKVSPDFIDVDPPGTGPIRKPLRPITR